MVLHRTSLGIVVLAAGAWLSHGVRLHPESQLHADFSACGSMAPCAQAGPSYYMGRVLSPGYERAQAIATMGRKAAVVVVGADGLGSGANWTGVHLYKTILENLGVQPRMVFVEPVAEKAPEFWDNTLKLPIPRYQVQLVTSMLDGECKSKNQTMYMISSEAGRDFHFHPRILAGWTSMVKSHPFRCLDDVASKYHFIGCGGDGNCVEGLRSFANTANRSSYLTEISVPCLTLQELLQSTEIAPEDVAMLIVNAAERDAAIVGPMLDDPVFEPGVIMFAGGVGGRNQELVTKLHDMGYSVGTRPAGNGTAAERRATNVIAIRRAL